MTGEDVVDISVCHYTLAVMATAGLYEASGDWLYDIGLPGKSGISGGIVTVSPGKAAWPLRAAARRPRQQREGPAGRPPPRPRWGWICSSRRGEAPVSARHRPIDHAGRELSPLAAPFAASGDTSVVGALARRAIAALTPGQRSRRTRGGRDPFRGSGSAWVPSSTMRPPSITTARSAIVACEAVGHDDRRPALRRRCGARSSRRAPLLPASAVASSTATAGSPGTSLAQRAAAPAPRW